MNGILMNPTTHKINTITSRIRFPGILLILGILFYTIYISQLKAERGFALIQLRVFESDNGWAYKILANGKIYIMQERIPALIGERPFRTREEALLVGNKVLEKMKEGYQLPTISLEELVEMGILSRDSLPKLPDSLHRNINPILKRKVGQPKN
jgi:hypothetical protein